MEKRHKNIQQNTESVEKEERNDPIPWRGQEILGLIAETQLRHEQNPTLQIKFPAGIARGSALEAAQTLPGMVWGEQIQPCGRSRTGSASFPRKEHPNLLEKQNREFLPRPGHGGFPLFDFID